jgi:hypothetical protein
MAADAGNAFSMSWLFLVSIGAVEGFSGSNKANENALTTLIQLSTSKTEKSENVRNAIRFLDNLCLLFLGDGRTFFPDYTQGRIHFLQAIDSDIVRYGDRVCQATKVPGSSLVWGGTSE